LWIVHCSGFYLFFILLLFFFGLINYFFLKFRNGSDAAESKPWPGERVVSGASAAGNHESSLHPPSSTDTSAVIARTANELGLRPEYFLPTSNSTLLQDSDIISPHTLEGSTFNTEDVIKSKLKGGRHDINDSHREKTNASGFGADEAVENPFEVCFMQF
jgi:hypothetical protein